MWTGELLTGGLWRGELWMGEMWTGELWMGEHTILKPFINSSQLVRIHMSYVSVSSKFLDVDANTELSDSALRGSTTKAVTGATLFCFIAHCHSRLHPLITTSLEVIYGQDNNRENSFVTLSLPEICGQG
ncbi:Uncharacterized protein Rs2_18425 [Raphanus sativus]|nr:Uncharacterized protein Rs2_18425 [Raphanus sativus]